MHMTSTQGQDRVRRPGVWMTNEIKQTMRRDTFTLLDTERLALWAGFVSGTPGMRGTLAAQLRNYKYETKDARDVFGDSKVILTGKASGVNDDLCICLQMVVFWSQAHFQKPSSVVTLHPKT